MELDSQSIYPLKQNLEGSLVESKADRSGKGLRFWLFQRRPPEDRSRGRMEDVREDKDISSPTIAGKAGEGGVEKMDLENSMETMDFYRWQENYGADLRGTWEYIQGPFIDGYDK